MIKEKRHSLSFSMVGMLIACWLIPLVVITMCMVFLITSSLNRQIEKTVITSTDKAAEICEIKLEEIWNSSKNASYSNTIRDSYTEFLNTKNGEKLYTDIVYYLGQQYKYDESMLCTIVFMLEDTDKFYYTYNTYQNNNKGNEGFNRISYFKNNVLKSMVEVSGSLDTGVKIVRFDEHLYMVRNLVDSNFKPYAMIVIEMDMPDVFSSLKSVWGIEKYQVFIDGEGIYEDELIPYDVIPDMKVGDSAYFSYGGSNFSTYKSEFEEQEILYTIKIDKTNALNGVRVIVYAVMVIAAFILPLMIILFNFFNKQISRPVKDIVKVAEGIALGEYGLQVETEASSKEFEYLVRSLNIMSSELKYQFETIYQEELELRDANIMALQSQINPHFLNNTLEIINWEARLSGSENVSGMIEALGTMLNATLNRKQRKFVTLAEELSYVDAYLYIIQKRFGNRFESYREVDESLLEMEVPMLIIQPIVENAVEHGVELHKKGTVGIRVYSDWDKIIIEVINNGVLSDEDRRKISLLLSDEEQSKEQHHVSLGIRNVNRRLKIIYGDDCGLSIESSLDDEATVSKLIVKMVHESEEMKK